MKIQDLVLQVKAKLKADGILDVHSDEAYELMGRCGSPVACRKALQLIREEDNRISKWKAYFEDYEAEMSAEELTWANESVSFGLSIHEWDAENKRMIYMSEEDARRHGYSFLLGEQTGQEHIAPIMIAIFGGDIEDWMNKHLTL